MSAPSARRSHEVAAKLALLRETLARADAGAVRLRGADWFAWVTAGGRARVPQDADVAGAQVLVTREEACVLTDEIDAARLRDEEVPAGFTFHIAPWAQPELSDDYVRGAAGGLVLADRPRGAEQALPAALRAQRMVLGLDEQQRYRELGRDAAEAVGEALRMARPDWSEWQLAGAGAAALWRRGIEPALLLAAGARRMATYRHPAPSAEALGRRAMLVCCARRHGLHANLTRVVSFGPARLDQSELMTVEATGLSAIRPGNSLAAVFHALAQAYRHVGHDGAIRAQQQGGITGYRPCEMVATDATATPLEAGMALALNPSFDGLRVEDTFLLGPHGLENLTFDPDWPATEVQGRMRPLWLEAT
jgi:Xaa-Pro aminopeptidase